MSDNYTLEIFSLGGKEKSCQVARIDHWDRRDKIMFIILRVKKP